jgi:hypothetical protein
MRRQGLVQTVRVVAVSLVAVGVAMSAHAQVGTPAGDLLRDRFVIVLGAPGGSGTGSLKSMRARPRVDLVQSPDKCASPE